MLSLLIRFPHILLCSFNMGNACSLPLIIDSVDVARTKCHCYCVKFPHHLQQYSYIQHDGDMMETKNQNWQYFVTSSRSWTATYSVMLSNEMKVLTRKHSSKMHTNRAVTRPGSEPVSTRPIVDRQTPAKTLPSLAVGKGGDHKTFVILIFTAHQRNCWKAMFSHTCVCLEMTPDSDIWRSRLEICSNLFS